ncbi:MAG: hypothetical protein GY940_38690 [bacterium]|nr:hypothetical protein [bacterium]
MMIIDTSLENAEKPGKFNDSIGGYGFTDVRLAEGRTFFTTTQTARTDQLNARAAKKEQTREIEKLKVIAEGKYRKDRVIGTEEFRDDPHMMEKLGFDRRRPGPFGERYADSMMLYDNLGTPGVLEAYARHSITPEALTGNKQSFTDVKTAIAERNRLKALAEKATETKEKAFDQLWIWWIDFKRVVNVALRDDPQLKEQVRIVARSFHK